jgi:hypothetical protein
MVRSGDGQSAGLPRGDVDQSWPRIMCPMAPPPVKKRKAIELLVRD